MISNPGHLSSYSVHISSPSPNCPSRLMSSLLKIKSVIIDGPGSQRWKPYKRLFEPITDKRGFVLVLIFLFLGGKVHDGVCCLREYWGEMEGGAISVFCFISCISRYNVIQKSLSQPLKKIICKLLKIDNRLF